MFKRNKNAAQDLSKSLEELTGGGSKTFSADPDEWTLTKDSAGNATAVIRILPAKGEGQEVMPFVLMHAHKFKVNGKWYWNNCPTTIKKECPACESNKELWDSGIEANKTLASERKRKLEYWANIVVIQDKLNEESVGKVMKWRFGSQIMEKILQKAKGDEDLGIPKVDVTDVWEGCNLVLRFVKTKQGGDYKQSEFLEASSLYNNDETKLNKVFEGLHSLSTIIAEDQFKPYNELSKKLAHVIGTSKVTSTVEDDLNDDYDSLNQTSTKSKKEDDELLVSSGDLDDDLDDFFDSIDE